MKMKIYCIIIVALLLNGKLFAQFGNSNSELMNELKTKKLHVIIDEENYNNNLLKETIQEEWTLTDFEFIKSSEIKSLKEDKNNFFLTYTSFKYDDTFSGKRMTKKITDDGLSLFFFPEDKAQGIINVKFSPASYYFSEFGKKVNEKINQSLDRYLNLQAKHIEAINMIENHINFYASQNLDKSLKPKEQLEYLSNKNAKSIQSKTLIFTQLTIPKRINTEKKLKKKYSHDFRFSTIEEVEDAILNKTSGLAYFKILNFRTLTFILVIDAETSEILYGEVGKGFDQLHVAPRVFEAIDKY